MKYWIITIASVLVICLLLGMLCYVEYGSFNFVRVGMALTETLGGEGVYLVAEKPESVWLVGTRGGLDAFATYLEGEGYTLRLDEQMGAQIPVEKDGKWDYVYWSVNGMYHKFTWETVGVPARSPAPAEPQKPRADAAISLTWREFTLTNAEGQRLVLDYELGDYPDGDMSHGEFHEIPASPAELFFDVPHSDSFRLELGGGRFSCSLYAETYGGHVYGEDVKTVEIREGLVSVDSGAGTLWITMDMPDIDWNLRLTGQTLGSSEMRRSGSIITVTGVTGDYSLWLREGDLHEYTPIKATAQTSELVIDLSRAEEGVLTVTDGDAATEYTLN